MLKSCAWLCLGVALVAALVAGPAVAQNPVPDPAPIPPIEFIPPLPPPQLPAPLVPPEPLPVPPVPVPVNPLLQNRQLVETMWWLLELNGDALATDFLPLPPLLDFIFPPGYGPLPPAPVPPG